MRVMLSLTALLSLSCLWSAPEAREVWLAPSFKTSDLTDLFVREAPWTQAAAATQVFKFYGNPFLSPLARQQLVGIIQDLRRRHIAMAVETGVMNVGAVPRPACGGWGQVEGYGPVALHTKIARKVSDAGGVIDYLVMDEPLYYGHFYRGAGGVQPGCRASLAEVIELVLPSLAVYKRAFPQVQIGAVEPSNALQRNSAWRADLLAWLEAFRTATGMPLAFLQIDAAWHEPAASEHAQAFYDYARTLRDHGLIGRLGIIYDGDPQSASDTAWVQAARDRAAWGSRTLHPEPEQIIFQSWDVHPAHALPESSPDTLTGLVAAYANSSPSPR